MISTRHWKISRVCVVRLLLNTHSFLWFIEGNSRLSTNARSAIDDVSNEIFLSMVSLWEIAIKVSIGKLSAPALCDLDPPDAASQSHPVARHQLCACRCCRVASTPPSRPVRPHADRASAR